MSARVGVGGSVSGRCGWSGAGGGAATVGLGCEVWAPAARGRQRRAAAARAALSGRTAGMWVRVTRVGLGVFAVGGEERGDAGRRGVEAKEIVGRVAGLAHVAENPVDGAGADAEFLDSVLDGADLFFHGAHEVFEVAELGFGLVEDIPDLAPFLLDGEHGEAHLEGGEDGGERGGAGDGDLAFGLQFGLEAFAAHDFGVEALGREEHDSVGGCDGLFDVLFADAPAFGTDGGLEGPAGGGDLFGRAGLIGGLEAFEVFAGKLGVDGHESFPGVSGEANGELNDLVGVALDPGIADELGGGEHLLEEHAELDLGEAASGFDVGEDAGEAVDAFGELGHLAEAGVDFGELVGDLSEGLGEPGVEGGVEFFVDGGAHLFKLAGVGGAEVVEALLDGRAELLLVGGVGVAKAVEAGMEGFAGLGVGAVGFGDEAGEAVLDGVEILLEGEAELLGGGGGVEAVGAEGFGGVGTEVGEVLGEGLAEVGEVAGDLVAEAGGGTGAGVAVCLSIGGGVAAEAGELALEVGDGGAELGIKRDEASFGAGLDAGEVGREVGGELGETGILLLGRRGLAQEERDKGEQDEAGEGEEREQHSCFLRQRIALQRRTSTRKSAAEEGEERYAGCELQRVEGAADGGEGG